MLRVDRTVEPLMMPNIMVQLAHQLLLGITQNFLGGRVDKCNESILIDTTNSLASRIQNQFVFPSEAFQIGRPFLNTPLQSLHGLLNGLFRFLPLGDVLNDRDNLGRCFML